MTRARTSPLLDGSKLVRLSQHELEGIARHGRVGPEIGQGLGDVLVRRVASGLKPATLMVSSAAAAYALSLGLQARAVCSVCDDLVVDFDPWPNASGEFAPDDPTDSEVVYAVATTTEAMARLEKAYQASCEDGEVGLWGHAELGLALGYTPADVAAYLLRARTRRGAEDPRNPTRVL